jgi:hypothetical protein
MSENCQNNGTEIIHWSNNVLCDFCDLPWFVMMVGIDGRSSSASYPSSKVDYFFKNKIFNLKIFQHLFFFFIKILR